MSFNDQLELDLIAILADGFGVDATVTPLPADGLPFALRGLFDSPFVGAELGGIPTEMQDARFSYKASDTSNMYEGCTLEIDTVIYDVIHIEPDGLLSDSGSMSVAFLRVNA